MQVAFIFLKFLNLIKIKLSKRINFLPIPLLPLTLTLPHTLIPQFEIAGHPLNLAIQPLIIEDASLIHRFFGKLNKVQCTRMNYYSDSEWIAPLLLRILLILIDR